MPTLNWIGKEAVIRHHKEVPFRLLEPVPERSSGNPENGNLLVQGDNLDALKALLPKYAGKVKCIYIDPPYNTGNEGWSYNDNVNSPEIRKWLGQVVGKEGETLDRHDRWLCMMYPRLILLRQFLREDGAIFISIDDNEVANLRGLMDEIFGAQNFIADIAWQRTYSTRNDSKGIVVEGEHILAYGKLPNWQPNKLERTAKMDSTYKNPDNDKNGVWSSVSATAPGAKTHQGMVYAIQHPITGAFLYPTTGRCWTFGQEDMLKIMRGWANYELRDIHDSRKRASICGLQENEIREGIKSIVLTDSKEKSKESAQKIFKDGNWPILYFTKNGTGGMRRKTYLEKVEGKPPTNLWFYAECGHTDEAKKELISIFSHDLFPTPKPTRLIQRILQIATDKDSLILDSFAGSGTTGHAVLKQNAEDGGTRKFILVEMDRNIAENVTAERLRRVCNGYENAKGQKIDGLGGGFQYCRLSQEPLFTPDGQIRDDVRFEQLAAFVWFLETKTGYVNDAKSTLLGVHEGKAIYLLYNGILGDKSRDGGNTLTPELYQELPPHDGPKIIYAAACWGSDWLKKENITFKQTPYELEVK